MPRTTYGFKKYIQATNEIAEIKRMADNYVKTHTDEYGEISDPQVYYNAIEVLASFSDDLTVANKIAGYKNSAKKIIEKIENAENSANIFDSKLQQALMNTIQENYKDARGLFFKMAEVYGTALDEFDEKVFGKALDDIPKGQTIPQGMMTYRDELKKKTEVLMNLSNSYMTEDPATESPGPLNSDVYGVFVRTSPQTGAIVNLDIGLVDSLDKAPTGYKRTESRYGRIPIYLNTYKEDENEVAKLGNAKYKYDSDDGILNLDEGALGWFGSANELLQRGFRAIEWPGEKKKETLKGVKQEQQEFPLSAVPFDYYLVPPENVVKDVGGNYYYYDKDSVLWKAENENMLKKYLRETGKNSDDVDNKVYMGHPDFISSRFLPDEEGKPRIINEEFFGGAIEPGSVSLPVSGEGEEVERLSITRWSAPSKELRKGLIPEVPKYIEGSGYETRKIIGEGEKIFKPTIKFS